MTEKTFWLVSSHFVLSLFFKEKQEDDDAFCEIEFKYRMYLGFFIENEYFQITNYKINKN